MNISFNAIFLIFSLASAVLVLIASIRLVKAGNVPGSRLILAAAIGSVLAAFIPEPDMESGEGSFYLLFAQLGVNAREIYMKLKNHLKIAVFALAAYASLVTTPAVAASLAEQVEISAVNFGETYFKKHISTAAMVSGCGSPNIANKIINSRIISRKIMDYLIPPGGETTAISRKFAQLGNVDQVKVVANAANRVNAYQLGFGAGMKMLFRGVEENSERICGPAILEIANEYIE